MKTSNANHDAHEYAERVRARLPQQLQKARLAAGMSRYRLAINCGITLETIGQIERGDTNPSVCVLAQICYGLGMTFTEFAAFLEDAS